eukprot:1160884-Pelagomonas_calceolata.AAC.21
MAVLLHEAVGVCWVFARPMLPPCGSPSNGAGMAVMLNGSVGDGPSSTWKRCWARFGVKTK